MSSPFFSAPSLSVGSSLWAETIVSASSVTWREHDARPSPPAQLPDEIGGGQAHFPGELQRVHPPEHRGVRLRRVRSAERRTGCREDGGRNVRKRRGKGERGAGDEEKNQKKFLPAGQKFKRENAKGPKVSGGAVTFVEDDLGGHVLGSAAEGPRLVHLVRLRLPPLSDADLLGETKVHLRGRHCRSDT